MVAPSLSQIRVSACSLSSLAARLTAGRGGVRCCSGGCANGGGEKTMVEVGCEEMCVLQLWRAKLDGEKMEVL